MGLGCWLIGGYVRCVFGLCHAVLVILEMLSRHQRFMVRTGILNECGADLVMFLTCILSFGCIPLGTDSLDRSDRGFLKREACCFDNMN